MKIVARRGAIYCSIIIVITLLVYLNSFKNGFVYDDHTHISDTEMRYFSNIPKFFINPFKEIYRPLRSVDYLIMYYLSDENPIGYHLHNILFHIANTILIYLIVDILLRKREISLIASLLFGVHPIHTERVTNITAGFDELGIFFILLAFYFYVLYSKNREIRNYVTSMASFILALFSSEEAIILPFLLILYEICFNKENLKKSLKFNSWFFVLGFIFVFFRFFVLKTGARASGYIAGNLFYTIFTMSKVFVRYIVLLFVPFKLTLYHELTIASSLFEPDVILSLALLLFLVFLAIRCYKTKQEITFAIGWFFITLVPFSNIVPITTLMAERYLYLPSFAFCLLIALFIHKLYNSNKNMKTLAIFILALLVVSYLVLTIKRNKDWRDDLTLWTATVKTSPLSSEAHDNLGFAYERMGRIDNALYEFKKAIELNPSNYKAYTNLGTSYAQKGNFTLAERYLKDAIKINPQHYKAYNYLGVIYGQQGRFNDSIIQFKKAINLNSDFDEGYYNLGVAYEAIGEEGLAKRAFEEAYKLNPKDSIYAKKFKTIEN